jgi:hypothetical protein
MLGETRYFGVKVRTSFTAYCQDLIPCLDGLRPLLFPDGHSRKKEDLGLYAQMKAVIEKARDDLRGEASQ